MTLPVILCGDFTVFPSRLNPNKSYAFHGLPFTGKTPGRDHNQQSYAAFEDIMENKLCEHNTLAPMYEVPFDVKSGKKTRFGSINECKGCGLKLVSPSPDIADIPAHYDLPKYYTHGENHIPEVQPSFLDRVITHLAWRTDRGADLDPSDLYSRHASQSKVLDIGCGAGSLLTKFANLGMETFGVDPDENARAQASGNGHHVFPGTAEAIPAALKDEKFDVVAMTHVLEHCLNPLEALQNARSLLSETGKFYCEVPNAGSAYFQTYGQISEMLDVPRHLFFFQKKDLEVLASAAGLEITGWRFHGLTRHFGASWKSWENSIFDRLQKANVETTCGRRSFFGDIKLLTSGALRPPERRYDCIGFLAHAAR